MLSSAWSQILLTILGPGLGLCSPRSGVRLPCISAPRSNVLFFNQAVSVMRGTSRTLCFLMFHFLNEGTQATRREATDFCTQRGRQRELPWWERLQVLPFTTPQLVLMTAPPSSSLGWSHHPQLIPMTTLHPLPPTPAQWSLGLNFSSLKLFYSQCPLR